MAPSAPSPLQLTAPLSSCTCISLPTSSRVRKTLNSELWHACTGPFVSLPQVKILIYYLSQGHSEEVLEQLEGNHLSSAAILRQDSSVWVQL
ncbi:auxin response factor 25 isoform X2 [Arachis hypogaea]|uniref:auxin response factor 25 isoform X2 n=1 Tax=Arachis hypogaea TaxID=3818 RepID=UPI000DED351C|nr:auxin response factor 25 [Arachis hypogaea]